MYREYIMYRICFVLLCISLLFLSGCGEKVSPAQDTFDRGKEMKAQDRYSDAIRLFTKATELDPEFEDAYLELALIYDDRIEDKQQAVVWYQKYMEVTENEKMKERVSNWIEASRRAAKELADGSSTELADIAPNTSALVNQIVEKKRAQLEREFQGKEATLEAKYENEITNLRDDIRAFTVENQQLRDTVEELEIEQENVRKTAAEGTSKQDLTALLASSDFTGPERELKKKMLELKQQNDALEISISQKDRELQQIQEKNVRLRQDIAAARELERTANANTLLKKQLIQAREENAELQDKVALLEKSVDIAEQTRITTDNSVSQEEVQRLENRIAELDKEVSDAYAAKQTAENMLADMQEQVDAILASNNADPSDILKEQNRKLRLQVASLTESFNAESERRSAAETTVRGLQEKLHTITNMPPAAQPVVASEFTDLSQEITAMQSTIEEQKTLLAQKDAQIARLAQMEGNAQNSRAETSRQKELIDELNRQLQAREQRIASLESDVASLRMSSPAQNDRVRSLEELLQKKDEILTEKELEVKDKIATIDMYEQSVNQLQAEKDALAQRVQSLEDSLSQSQINYARAQTTTRRTSQQYQPRTSTQPQGNLVDRTLLPPTISEPEEPTRTTTQPVPRTRVVATRTQPQTTTSPYYSQPRVNRPSRVAGAPRRPRSYRVRSGDTLSSIAQKVYGDRNKWKTIFAANRDILPRANSLKVGQVLYIPSR